jgi:hypothetical protein
MGEMADLVLCGLMCESCGECFEGDAPGYPRLCGACEPAAPVAPRVPYQSRRAAKAATLVVRCPVVGCVRMFATKSAADQHSRDYHWRGR